MRNHKSDAFEKIRARRPAAGHTARRTLAHHRAEDTAGLALGAADNITLVVEIISPAINGRIIVKRIERRPGEVRVAQRQRKPP